MLHLVINCGENHPSCEAVDFRRSGTFMVHSVVIHQVWYCIIFNKQILVVVTLHLR